MWDCTKLLVSGNVCCWCANYECLKVVYLFIFHINGGDVYSTLKGITSLAIVTIDVSLLIIELRVLIKTMRNVNYVKLLLA